MDLVFFIDGFFLFVVATWMRNPLLRCNPLFSLEIDLPLPAGWLVVSCYITNAFVSEGHINLFSRSSPWSPPPLVCHRSHRSNVLRRKNTPFCHCSWDHPTDSWTWAQYSKKYKKHYIYEYDDTLNDYNPVITSGMSLMANSPTRLMQLTVHFWVVQFGSHEWFMKRAKLPFGPASIIKSFSTPKK